MFLNLGFRVIVASAVVGIACLSISNLIAEYGRQQPSPIPVAQASNAAPAAQIAAAEQVATIAPFRSDKKAQYALALTNQALASAGALQINNNADAQSAVKAGLRLAPHNASMWLALALLLAQRDADDPLVIEALKMSYFTGPSRSELVQSRISLATATDALIDQDLRQLATTDVWAIIRNSPEKQAFLNDNYARASSVGKTFLKEAIQTIDPQFLSALQGSNR